MAHDVFVSYANADKATADMVCAVLEQRGIRCWIAPRDLRPGADWGGAIVAAIRASRALVLVFSEAANASRHIPRELERAIDHEIPVIPFRVENVPPRGSLEYSLSSVHWLDAVTPPLEAHVARLADSVGRTVGVEPPAPPAPPPPAPPPETPQVETPPDTAPEHVDAPEERDDAGSEPPPNQGRRIVIAAGAATMLLMLALWRPFMNTDHAPASGAVPAPLSETPGQPPVNPAAASPNSGASADTTPCATLEACQAAAMRARAAEATLEGAQRRAEPFDQRACDLGDFQACTDLGLGLDTGIYLPKDQARAIALYRRACDNGNAEGCFRIGSSYQFGNGVAKDGSQAVGFFQRACEGNYGDGCNGLAMELQYGDGVAKDTKKAVALYARACDLHAATGCFNLGQIYESGEVPELPRDPAIAAGFYERACADEDWQGCTSYGRLLLLLKSPADFAPKALAAFQKACKNGEKAACDALKGGG